MTETTSTEVSKLLSFVLRHKPSFAGVTPDDAGWVEIDALLTGLSNRGKDITREQIERIVKNSDKQRFSISDDGSRIRCSQGHSIDVDLGYKPAEPPDLLYHGTATRFLNSIAKGGLKRGARHHVHLSSRLETAEQVGKRHGKLVLLTVKSGDMHRNDFQFFLSDNGVWLTEHVPADYIVFPEPEK